MSADIFFLIYQPISELYICGVLTKTLEMRWSDFASGISIGQSRVHLYLTLIGFCLMLVIG